MPTPAAITFDMDALDRMRLTGWDELVFNIMKYFLMPKPNEVVKNTRRAGKFDWSKYWKKDGWYT